MWTFDYQTTINHSVNPFLIDYVFPVEPVIVYARTLIDYNLRYRLGRLTFTTNVAGVGDTKGKSQVIHRGNQIVDTSQLIDGSYKAEFYLYGYIQEVELKIWIDS